MDDNTKALLEVEQAKGEAAARVFEQYIEPFFIKKRREMFEIFEELPATAKKELVILKMQSNALKSLEDEFKTTINSGKLARQQLEEDDDG